jgi:hypothetical protein
MQHINNTPADSGLGDSLFVSMNKINANFEELVAIDASFSGYILTLNTIINDGSLLNHTHTIAQIEGLQTALNSKVSTSTFNSTILSINNSIQAINEDLSDIIILLNNLETNKVPYTGATRDVILGENIISSNIGFFVENDGSIINQAQLANIGEYLTLYVNSDSTSNGTNQFEVNPSTGLYYTKTYNDITSTLGFADNFFDVQFYSNSANTTTNQFYVNDTETFSKNGYTSIFGENGSSFKANTYFDGITRVFDFFTGKGDYSYTNQYGSLYASAEEGLYFSMYSDEISSTIQSNPNRVFITVYEYTTDNTNYLYLNLEETFTIKKIVTDEGFVGNYVQFNTAATETSAVGKLKWNDNDGSLDLGLKGGNTTLQIGQETVVRVVNKTGANLLEENYQVVRVRTQAEGGAAGQRLAVKLAQADTKANHRGILGLVTEDINNNQEGFITTFGVVNKINTTGSLQGETWNDGDTLWLSDTTAGGLTNLEPINHPVQIGYVIYSHSNNGKIFVYVNNGVDELDELHDVKISAATSGDVLTYNSSTQVWENKSLNEITGEFNYILTTPVSFSGTAQETEVLRLEIPPYTFAANDMLKIPTLLVQKTGVINSYSIRVKISTSETMPATTTDMVAVYNGAANASHVNMTRTFFLSGGVLRGLGTANIISDYNVSTTQLNVAFDHTVTNYLYISIDSAGPQDTQTLVGFQLTNR